MVAINSFSGGRPQSHPFLCAPPSPLRIAFHGVSDASDWKLKGLTGGLGRHVRCARGTRALLGITSSQPPRTVFALIVINKAGGLVYNKNFHDGLNQISTNDYLVLAGTFHG